MLFGSLGVNVLDEGNVRQVTTEYEFHKNYNETTFLHDIALIRTACPLIFTATVNVVHLPGYSMHSHDLRGESATVCGWGKISDKNDTTGECLLCTTKSIIDENECLKYFPAVFKKELHICLDASYGSGSCGGDSGGALVWEDEEDNSVQVGIVSFGSDYCEDGKPGVYIRVSNYLNWIKAHSDIEIDP